MLPEEIHGQTVSVALSDEPIESLRKFRLACQAYTKAAGAAVHTLQSDAACGITSGAWKAFPSADGFRMKAIRGKGSQRSFQEMMDRVPEGRIKRFFFSASYGTKGSWTDGVPAVITQPRNAKHLQKVSFHKSITSAEADNIISGLPELEDLSIKVKSQQWQWPPAGNPRLRKMILSMDTYLDSPQQVNIQGIARSSNLQVLHLSLVQPVNWAAIAALKQLQELSISNCQKIQPLQHLQQLHTFISPWTLKRADWQILAALPQLGHVEAKRLILGPSSPSSDSITRLEALQTLFVVDGQPAQVLPVQPGTRAGVPAGFLTARMPKLQEFYTMCKHYSPSSFAHLLTGHSALCSLTLQDSQGADASWPPGCLSSLISLELLSLDLASSLDLDALLTAASACVKLRQLHVKAASYESATGTGLEALAAGACRDSLEVVDIKETRQPLLLRCAVPLLKLASLQRAALCLRWHGPSSTMPRAAALLQRLQAEGLQPVIEEMAEDDEVYDVYSESCWPQYSRMRLVHVRMRVNSMVLQCRLMEPHVLG